MSRTDYLDDISHIVMSAENKQIALEDLSQTLPPKAHYFIRVLRDILAGKEPNIAKLKRIDSIWVMIFRLAKQSDKPKSAFLGQYCHIAKSKVVLSNKKYIVGYLYFIWVMLFLQISFSITMVKILPVLESFFAGFGANLPKLTKLVINRDFQLITQIIFYVIAVLAILVPWLYIRQMKRLSPIPRYLRCLPFYMPLTRYYHRYLHTIFTGVYYRAGEDDPLRCAAKLLPKNHTMNEIEQGLLTVAMRQGSFEEVLQSQQEKLADSTTKVARITDSLIGGLLFVFYAVLVATYVIGAYLPIFMLGDVIG
ncbi:MAG: hypothetical protein KGV56_02965 [Gammaproteobacteria bacterium]|nr:hypothetical protein [Gammaproteobacteria bacterium]